MASKNNHGDSNLQEVKHCVLIDGDFQRHELFTNIHPYTLNRIRKLNGEFTFGTCTEETLKLMNSTANIHYHICYNSRSVEIDEYYKVLKITYPQNIWFYPLINTTADKNNNEDTILKFEEVISTYKCDYIWIIHGIENPYKNLIERLQSINPSKVKIFHYSWIENLKDGSNRIQYLINNKIRNLREYRVAELISQPDSSTSIPITTKSTEQKTNFTTQAKCNIGSCEKQLKGIETLSDHQTVSNENASTTITSKTREKKTVECDFQGCDQHFKNDDALKNHQLAKHISSQSNTNEEKPNLLTSKTENKEKICKKPMRVCNVDGCEESDKKFYELEYHQIVAHPTPLRCPFSIECLNSNEKHLNIRELMSHVIFQHADSFPRRICPIPGCPNQTHLHDWFDSLQHILQKHRNYLLNDIIRNIAEQDTTTSELDGSFIQTESKRNIPCWSLFKCPYNGCHRYYWEEESLKRHEAFEHPIGLKCPYGSECQQSTFKYIGLWKLRRHILKMHTKLFSEPTCFDSECKAGEKKPFKSWPAVLRHILYEHLHAVGIITESTTSLTRNNLKTSKKCSYDTCDLLFDWREKFQYHLVIFHSYPLRCPYNSRCNKSDNAEGYLGLMELEKHIKTEHSKQYQTAVCFHSKCQAAKKFQNWNSVVDHILDYHWLDIKLN